MLPLRSMSADLKEKVRALPETPGVYLMKDHLGRIIYVGKAKSLKKRVSSYFQPGRTRALRHQPKIRTLIEMIADFEIIEVKSETEALLLEGKLIKQWRPKYNTDFTDDKRFLLVRLNADAELPRFVLTRFRKDDRSRYFGPFAHSGLLRRTLASMRKQFGVLLGDTQPVKLPDGRWRLWAAIRNAGVGHLIHGWVGESLEAGRGRQIQGGIDRQPGGLKTAFDIQGHLFAQFHAVLIEWIDAEHGGRSEGRMFIGSQQCADDAGLQVRQLDQGAGPVAWNILMRFSGIRRGLAECECGCLCESIGQQNALALVIMGSQPVIGAHHKELDRHGLWPLMQLLKERVLCGGPAGTPDHRGGVQSDPVRSDAGCSGGLAVTLHDELLQPGGQQCQTLCIGHHGLTGISHQGSVPDRDQSQHCRKVVLGVLLEKMRIHARSTLKQFAEDRHATGGCNAQSDR